MTVEAFDGWTELPEYQLELVGVSRGTIFEMPYNEFSRHNVSMYEDNMLYDVTQLPNKSDNALVSLAFMYV